jgi:hypothetical protein
VRTGAVTATECLHQALKPTRIRGDHWHGKQGAAGPSVASPSHVQATFKPMNPEQLGTLLSRTKNLAMTGQHERFKTTAAFDATARHPEWTG